MSHAAHDECGSRGSKVARKDGLKIDIHAHILPPSWPDLKEVRK